MINRFTRVNESLIINMSNELLNELIYLDDVIPDGLNNSLRDLNPIFCKERSKITNNDVFIKKVQELRFELQKRHKEIGVNAYLEFNIEFIKKYPQFTCLIDHIEFRDDDLNFIKEVPIDEYLALEEV